MKTMLASSKLFVIKSMLLSCFATFSVVFYGDRLRTENLKWQKVAAGNKTRILPPFIRYREQYLVLDKYRLATCQIEKIMSTIRGAIFCFLTDSTKFLNHNRTISEEPWKKKERFCKERDYVRENLDKTLEKLGHEGFLFTVVRNPVERLISGFVDKCLRERHKWNSCYGCPRKTKESSLRCFLDRLYCSLQNVLQNKNGDVYFDRHFAPQSWYCDFKNHIGNYTIFKYSNTREGIVRLASQFDHLFNKAGISSFERKIIKEEILKGSTSHSTHGSEEVALVRQLISSNKELLKKVISIYYYDFVIFGFPLPVAY